MSMDPRRVDHPRSLARWGSGTPRRAARHPVPRPRAPRGAAGEDLAGRGGGAGGHTAARARCAGRDI